MGLQFSMSSLLKTDSGRYEEIPRNERICSFGNSNKIEDESHFLLDCKADSKIRDIFFSKIELKIPNLKITFKRYFNSSSYDFF